MSNRPQTWTADNGNGTFSNPLFYDEFSDPDLIRVGRDFYLTGTTMHAMPGLPVLHSRDLVNWRWLCYAADRLDFGPQFRLENGQEVYGQGIWAPSFRYNRGTFYIFTNVRGQPMQVYRAANPAGPWKCTAMKRGFHDPSVLFDDDGRIYIVWGSGEVRVAELSPQLDDIVPGSERVVIKPDAGMGEGSHFYKINGLYYITSAKYPATMPCARANHPYGPYEVNPAISGHEDFGVANLAMHQGGIVDTPTGEWWGFSMMDYNSLGRLTGLSPVTWKDGWPYFGLPGNLGRTPRTWVKPNTGATSLPTAPYERSDHFSAKTLKSIWQWNHVPDDSKWSLTERPGYLRLHSLPATEFWWARNTLTQRTIGPVSTATVEMELAGMKPGDIAGLGLLNSPYAWLSVHCEADGFTIEQLDKTTDKTTRSPVRATRIWLRAECDFFSEKAHFHYSTNGKTFQPLGDEFTMRFQLKTFQGVRYSLFHYNASGAPGGYADFDRIVIEEPHSRGVLTPIPYKKTITLAEVNSGQVIILKDGAIGSVPAAHILFTNPAARFLIVNRGQGRVALQTSAGFLSVSSSGVKLTQGTPTDAETFQWIETIQGELTLLSLATHRYLCISAEGIISADHTGPQRNRKDTCHLRWKI
ncbi:MAG: glycoside hydrolase 43 family protein [Armatimonas sp.]